MKNIAASVLFKKEYCSFCIVQSRILQLLCCPMKNGAIAVLPDEEYCQSPWAPFD